MGKVEGNICNRNGKRYTQRIEARRVNMGHDRVGMRYGSWGNGQGMGPMGYGRLGKWAWQGGEVARGGVPPRLTIQGCAAGIFSP